jgi:hypothetical protein
MSWTICVNFSLKMQPTGKISNNTGSVIAERYPAFDVINKYGTKCGRADMASAASEVTEGQFALVNICQRSFWALVLGWEDGIAVRRGVAKLSEEAIEASLEPGPRWKAIVLG